MIIPLSDTSVKLCCNGKGCPVVTKLENGMVEIVDDNGNRIIVKEEEAALISDGVKTLTEKKQLLLG
jgi:glycosyltransferase involved in cell wall biosynthesis